MDCIKPIKVNGINVGYKWDIEFRKESDICQNIKLRLDHSAQD